MNVDLGCRVRKDDTSIRPQQLAQSAQEASALIRIGNVVERKRTEDEVEAARCKMAEIAVVDQIVGSLRISSPGEPDHAGRDVGAARIESQALQKSRRAAGPATKVECDSPRYIFCDDARQVAVRKIVGPRELQLGVGGGPAGIVIYIGR